MVRRMRGVEEIGLWLTLVSVDDCGRNEGLDLAGEEEMTGEDIPGWERLRFW